MSPIHQEWDDPHASCHAPVKYGGSQNTAVTYRSDPRPRKTSAPPAPQTRRLRVPDQCRALRPEVLLVQSTADVPAHFVVPPAKLRADPAGLLDTDDKNLACAASSWQATTMATMQRASPPIHPPPRPGPTAQDRNIGLTPPDPED